jgi:hypothetical protein
VHYIHNNFVVDPVYLLVLPVKFSAHFGSNSL